MDGGNLTSDTLLGLIQGQVADMSTLGINGTDANAILLPYVQAMYQAINQQADATARYVDYNIDPSEGRRLMGAGSIIGNAFTGGGLDALHLTNSGDYNGSIYSGAKISAGISREAFILALTAGTGEAVQAGRAGLAGKTAFYGANLYMAGQSGQSLGTGINDALDGRYGAAAFHSALGLLGATGSFGLVNGSIPANPSFFGGVRSVVRTNAELVEEIGTRAKAWGSDLTGTAREIGTAEHVYAKNLLNRYQRMFGDRGLVTESSWVLGEPVPYGTAGSVRLDVLDLNTRAVWDYKFGITPMSAAQELKIMTHGPGVTSITPVMRP